MPLLLRAYDLWHELERESGESLLFEVGGLMLGSETSSVVSGCLQSARLHGLPHEVMSAAEISHRFPVFRLAPDLVGVYEKRAGYLLPEKCVLAHLQQAGHRGAELHFEEKVLSWRALEGDGVSVTTTKGTYEAAHLIISPGPWAPQVLSELGLPFEVERQVLYWFESSMGTEPFLPDHFPIFIWEEEDGAEPYGFPALDGPAGGVKVAFYRAPVSTLCRPESIDRTVHAEEIRVMLEAIASLIPSLTGRCVQAVTCMYTNTPDKNFILTRHPQHPQIAIGCGFSGHGFKFASVIGEILADLVVNGSTPFEIGFLSPARLL